MRSADVELPRGLIWVSGANGAGKTTFLEAVYVMDRGRTFRGRRFGPLMTRGESSASILGAVSCRGRRVTRSWRGKGGEGDLGVAHFSHFVGPSTFTLVEGDPSLRRRFLDWTLFHVEPRARAPWVRLRRLQLQRNAWLRSGARGAPIWDTPYAEAFDHFWLHREEFLRRLAPMLVRLTEDLSPAKSIGLQWRRPTGQSLPTLEVLSAQLASDKAQGFTQLSPSRADIQFSRDSVPWIGSRGENKSVGILLQLAAHELVSSAREDKPVLLVDDPYAELEERHARPLIGACVASAEQVIVTSFVAPTDSSCPSRPMAVFHVEHGSIRAS